MIFFLRSWRNSSHFWCVERWRHDIKSVHQSGIRCLLVGTSWGKGREGWWMFPRFDHCELRHTAALGPFQLDVLVVWMRAGQLLRKEQVVTDFLLVKLQKNIFSRLILLRVTVLPELLMDVLQASIEGSIGSRMLKPQIAAMELFRNSQNNETLLWSFQVACCNADVLLETVECLVTFQWASYIQLITLLLLLLSVVPSPSSNQFIWQMLGDPSFSPYDKHTFQPRWEAPALALSWKLENGLNKV